MSDEPRPEDEVPAVEPETPSEAKPAKKAKAEKKKAASAAAPDNAEETTGAAPTDRVVEAPAVAVAETSTQADEFFQQGVQSLLRGDYDAAEIAYGQALTLRQKSADRAGQVAVLRQLGHLAFLRGAEAAARDYYQQAQQSD